MGLFGLHNISILVVDAWARMFPPIGFFGSTWKLNKIKNFRYFKDELIVTHNQNTFVS
jgi:hypothetical protein